MADPNYAFSGEDNADDLPRTFKREKEAREREAREKAARERAAAPSLSMNPDYQAGGPATATAKASLDPGLSASKVAAAVAPVAAGLLPGAVVRDIDVPFPKLVRFFLKAVIAAIPALFLLMIILWAMGHAFAVFFPDLAKMKILIGFGG